MRAGVLVQKLKCLLPNEVSLANLNRSGSVMHACNTSHVTIQIYLCIYFTHACYVHITSCMQSIYIEWLLENIYLAKYVYKIKNREFRLINYRARTGTQLFLSPFPNASNVSSGAKQSL